MFEGFFDKLLFRIVKISIETKNITCQSDKHD